MIYMQVDVPMDRPPVTNWVLIAVTVVFTIKGWAEDRKVQRMVDPVDVVSLDIENLDHKLQDDRLTEAQREQIVRQAIPDVDPETLRQLKNPRLTDERREEILEKELERHLKQTVPAQTAPTVPVNRFALHTATGDFRLWQLVTYQFVHADFWHLVGNMLFLFCFGNAINAKLGHWQFIVLYLACGIVAGLGWLALGRGGALVGASGAIAGINGVFLIFYPLNQITVWDLLYVQLTGDALRIPSWVFIVFYMVMDLVGTMTHWGGAVAYVCHLAGESLGIGIAVVLVLTGLVTSGRGEKNLFEMWGWVEEPKPKRRKRRRPPPPRPTPQI